MAIEQSFSCIEGLVPIATTWCGVLWEWDGWKTWSHATPSAIQQLQQLKELASSVHLHDLA